MDALDYLIVAFFTGIKCITIGVKGGGGVVAVISVNPYIAYVLY